MTLMRFSKKWKIGKMKARVVNLDRKNRWMTISLIDWNNKICLKTLAECRDEDFVRLYYPIQQKCIFVKNIGKIINKVFSIFDYDENKIGFITFIENVGGTDYVLITFKEDK